MGPRELTRRGMRAAGARPRTRALVAVLAAALVPALAAPLGADAIIGGNPAPSGSYPWLAHVADALGRLQGECTGTVVAPRLVLTAGHCVFDAETGQLRDPSGFTVAMGNVDWRSQPRELRRVSGEALAPGYDPRTGANDAALLVLTRRTSAPAVQLGRPGGDASLLQAGTPAWLVGWGDTRHAQPSFTANLHEAQTALQEAAWCELEMSPFDSSGQLCVIDAPSYAATTCEGDSGGPLIVGAHGEARREEAWIDVGVLSGGLGLCESSEPSLYTRVDALYPWIRRWVAQLGGVSATRIRRAARR